MKKPFANTLSIGMAIFVLGVGAGRATHLERTGQKEELERVLSSRIRVSNLGKPKDERVPWSCELQRHLEPFSISRNGEKIELGRPEYNSERWRIDLDDGQTIIFAASPGEPESKPAAPPTHPKDQHVAAP
jgi:hypothetical protein